MRLGALAARRPTALAMFFVALALLGLVALARMPIELLPSLAGDTLYVNFSRPGSEPELVERELLAPLGARVTELAGVVESRGSVQGSSGRLEVRFEPGAPLAVRELELRQMAAELARGQPGGTFVQVSALPLDDMRSFVAALEVVGRSEPSVLRALVEDEVLPSIASVPGVARAVVVGGQEREIGVAIDEARLEALGVAPNAVAAAVAGALGRLEYAGSLESGSRRQAVLVDGRPRGVISLGRTRVDAPGPVRIEHVAEIDEGFGEAQSLSLVDGEPALSVLVFKNQGANLVRVGAELERRLASLAQRLAPIGVSIRVGFSGAETVTDEVSRLARLALVGFGVALVVLLAFLREPRALVVVGVAVPMSVLVALAFLYLLGQSINLVTLFGLAVSIGLLVDASIVVYEAIFRSLERGACLDEAVDFGVSRTARALAAATATNAVVFLPLLFVELESATLRSLVLVLVLAILAPLCASLVVALGLVPLLARRFAGPAALERVRRESAARVESGSPRLPERSQELFAALLVVALRRPGAWLAGTALAVVVTVIGVLPLLASSMSGGEAPSEGERVRMEVRIAPETTLERARSLFERLELPLRELEGIESVASVVRESGGLIDVRLEEEDERGGLELVEVRRRLLEEAQRIEGLSLVEASGMGEGGGEQDPLAAALGQGPRELRLSAPSSERLADFAEALRARLAEHPAVGSAWVSASRGLDEVLVRPRESVLESYGLLPEELFPALAALRSEGLTMREGMTLPDGRELGVRVERAAADTEPLTRARLAAQRLPVAEGARPLAELFTFDLREAPAPITHRDGRREVSVYYTLGAFAPAGGAARGELVESLEEELVAAPRPAGATITTADDEESTRWFRVVLLPVVLLLFGVLAITFESLTSPILVLVALPLTLIGGAWALMLSGTPAGLMALVGALALMGITVNPAILLVERMRARVAAGASPGAAALAGVRERVRPVLMTSATTIAGLWPLALSTGRENELWPPFAVVLVGGLLTSTLLTLLVVPAGFALLARVDALLRRLPPLLLLGGAALVAALIAGLVAIGFLPNLTWQLLGGVAIVALALGLAARLAPAKAPPDPLASGAPPRIETRFLGKVYGEPGPLGNAWRAPEEALAQLAPAARAKALALRARRRLVPLGALLFAALFVWSSLDSLFWRPLVALFAAFVAGLLLRAAAEVLSARGATEPTTPRRALRVVSGAGLVAGVLPWGALALSLPPALAKLDEGSWGWVFNLGLLGLLLLVAQHGRRSARRMAEGRLEPPEAGPLAGLRLAWRAFVRRAFGFGLPAERTRALEGVDLVFEGGMIGVLGPNGAGKTTLLRLLSSVLEPTRGAVRIGGVRLEELRARIGEHVGYLPQDFGLPDAMRAREYLEYWALLYRVGDRRACRQRVDELLEEVGLAERGSEPIASFSGGMRQRLAIARTLLKLPPVVIVDEPTVGLDPRERIRFRNLLSRLARGRVVLFSTHVVEDVEVACSRVVVVAAGRVVFDGAPGRLADQARGRVFTMELDEAEAAAISARVRVIDQRPLAQGRVLVRVLADEAPDARAVPAPPSVEDAYLLLTAAERAA